MVLGVFSRVLRDSTPRFVGPSVRRSVGPLVRWSVGPLVRWSVGPSVRRSIRHTTFSALFGVLTLTMAPAHPHATGVAVYPVLFFHQGGI